MGSTYLKVVKYSLFCTLNCFKMIMSIIKVDQTPALHMVLTDSVVVLSSKVRTQGHTVHRHSVLLRQVLLHVVQTFDHHGTVIV